ncbi:MAG: hypothetical protein Q9216_003023 [Gyalolechia sp. 2 TL-2023]
MPCSKLNQAIKADTAGIGTIKEHVSELHAKDDAKRREQVLEWFSPLNFFKAQQNILRRREEDTGKWLIDLPAFQEWVAGSSRMLCCAGMPGAGKSVLASIVVDHLRNGFESSHPFGVAAAYCNFKEQDTQSPENLIAGLCVQLMDDSDPMPEMLMELYKSHHSRKTRPMLSDVFKVFIEATKRLQTTYLVIDALDECPSEVRDVLVPELRALPSDIKLLVTTRHVDSITRLFSASSTIEVLARRDDLEKYIISKIASSSRLSGLLKGRATLVNEICDKIIEKANGM